MNEAQADTVSLVFAEMATRSDLLQLEERMIAELATIRADLRTERAEIRTELVDLRSEMTWQMIVIVGFFATASTLLNLFVG